MSALSVFAVQPVAMRILQAAAERGRISHAYLFYGPAGTGKWHAATILARWLLCSQENHGAQCDCATCTRINRYQHPDVHWVLPLVTSEKTAGDEKKAAEETDALLTEKRSNPWAALDYPRRPYITAKKIRAMQAELSRTAVEGGRKIGIIVNAEHLRQDVQSILLKTIEEPPRDTHLILTTSEKSTLLSTILSRCQPIRFAPLPDAVLEEQLRAADVPDPEIPFAVALAGGSLTRAHVNMSEEGILWRHTAWALLRLAVLGTPEELLAQLDEVFRRRPDTPVLLRFVDTWDFAIHRVLTQLGPGDQNDAPGPFATTLFGCYQRLGEIRAALNGNVTPRIAVASALLDVQMRLAPFRAVATAWFPEEMMVLSRQQAAG